MNIIKPRSSVPVEWLWHYEDGEREVNVFNGLDKTSLLFGIFYLDKFATEVEIHLQDLRTKAEEHLHPWNEHYPWSEYNKVSLQLKKMENGTPFIFGELCVEDHIVEEESLMVALLQRFSSELGPHVFIRICDTDGDFILAEVCDKIPNEYEYPVAGNRLWLHEGRFKMIPLPYCDKVGVRPEEALDFLKESYFRCLEIDTINKCISDKMGDFPNRYLSNLVKLPLIIETQKNRELLQANPQLISFLIKNLSNEAVSVSEDNPSMKAEKLELLVSKDDCKLIPFFFEEKNLSRNSDTFPLLCGRAVSSVLDILLEEELIFLDNAKVVEKPRPSSDSIFSLSDFEVATVDFNLPHQSASDNLLEALANSLMSEINISGKSHVSESDEENFTDSDEECKRYLKTQDVDIDEEDFFEFFLKEGLRLDDLKIDALRAEDVD